MWLFIGGQVVGFILACAVGYWMIKVTAKEYSETGYIKYRGKTYIFRETFDVGPADG